MTIFQRDAYTNHETMIELTVNITDGAEGPDEDLECHVEYNLLEGVPEIAQSWGSPGRPATPAVFDIVNVSCRDESGSLYYPDLDNEQVEYVLEKLREKHEVD